MKFPHLVSLLLVVGTAAAACSDDDKKKRPAIVNGPSSPAGPGDTDAPLDQNVYAITASTDLTSLKVADTANADDPVCATVTATVKLADKVKEGVNVAFSFSGKSGNAAGTVSPTSTKTDASGVAVTKFCSAKAEDKIYVIAKAGKSSANTAVITISKRAIYSLKYVGAQGVGGVEFKPDGNVDITLEDGDADCADLKFALLKDTSGIAGVKGRFKTAEGIPAGARLAVRTDAGMFETNPQTGRKAAVYDADSDGTGMFKVPVCGGTQPGGLRVTGFVAAEGDRPALEVEGPIVSIKGSKISYDHISLTMDQKNTSIGTGGMINNLKSVLKFVAELGARIDVAADISRRWPLGVLTELGTVKIEGNGIPSDKGQVGFSLEFMNLNAHRPYEVYPGYSITCHPDHFATKKPYSELAKNWLNKLVFYVEGREQFYDANGNGRYDGPSEGFWDVNQNGIFDGNDVLTNDLNGNSVFDSAQGSGEWFIDQPTPFVDVNDDGRRQTFEPLLGTAYLEPNGRWDDLTTIWKSINVPLYMGTSPYALGRNMILSRTATPAPTAADLVTSNLGTFFQSHAYSSALHTNPQNRIVGVALDTHNTQAGGSYVYLGFAHDVCGNPVPGGTEIKTFVVTEEKASTGERLPVTKIFMQPPDTEVDWTRRLLVEATGESNAKVGPTPQYSELASQSYPVQFYADVPPCKNACTGDTAANPGLFCDAQAYTVRYSINGDTIGSWLNLNQVQTCSCATGATYRGNGVCKCTTDGHSVKNGICSP